MRDTWGPPADGWPSFCDHCGWRTGDTLHTCPVPDVAGRDVAVSRSVARRLAALRGEDVVEASDSFRLDGWLSPDIE